MSSEVRDRDPGVTEARDPLAESRPVRRADAESQSLAAILNLVRLGLATTRQALELETGLGRAVIADRLATLTGHGLIEEAELGQAAGGRPPRIVRFRAGAGLILMAVIGQSSLSVGVADLASQSIAEHHEPSDAGLPPDKALKRLRTLFDWLLEQHLRAGNVWGIGIAIDGPVDSNDAAPTTSPQFPFLPSWSGFPFVEQLAATYRSPVWLRSSVQMMTLGEAHQGDGDTVRDLLFVELGREITAGLISGGRLHRGFQGSAGMIGHIATSEDNTALCRCGNAGCLETVAGGDAVAREGLVAAQQGRSRLLAEMLERNGELTAADVGSAAQLGDPFSAELLARCGRLIGTALAAVINAVNPSVVVLGGVLAQTSDIPLATIRETVYRRSHPLVTRDLRIIRSQMSSSAGLWGAALVVAEALFAPGHVAGWIDYGAPGRHPDFSRALLRAESTLQHKDARPKPPPAGAAG